MGDTEAPAVICFHGWLDNLNSFEPLIPYLSNYRLILVDFPGHGQSDHLPPGMAYHFLDLVYVIQDVIAHFKLAEPIIMGHSMGGAASTLYSSISEKVKCLILIEALGPLTVTEDETVALMQKSITERQWLSSKSMPRYENIEKALAVRAHHSNINPDIIRPIVERGITKLNDGVSWSSDARLRVASINRLTEKQLLPLLQQIKCPVLLIEADQGMFGKNPLMHERKKWLSHLTTEVLSGGHHVHMEKPKAASALIQNFIEQHR